MPGAKDSESLRAANRQLTRRDAFLTGLKAILNLKGGEKGAAIAGFISDVIPTSAQQAIETALDSLAEKVSELETRINTKTINEEELADLFKGFQRVITNTNREEKLRAAANILANALLPPGDPSKSSYEELDHLMHCVDALSIGAIAALGAARQISLAFSSSNGAFHFPELRNKFPSNDPDLLMSLVSQLRGLHLIRVQDAPIGNPDYTGSLLGLTPIGFRFADRFIEGRM
jgi:hypothetical protein